MISHNKIDIAILIKVSRFHSIPPTCCIVEARFLGLLL